MVHRSCSSDQQEILSSIEALHLPDGFEADLTFGNGAFWRGRATPRLCFDLQPLASHVVQADSRMLPLERESIGSAVFDPPFLTYVRAGREGNGAMAMARRFGGYWTVGELEDHYQETISECHRVLRRGGFWSSSARTSSTTTGTTARTRTSSAGPRMKASGCSTCSCSRRPIGCRHRTVAGRRSTPASSTPTSLCW